MRALSPCALASLLMAAELSRSPNRVPARSVPVSALARSGTNIPSISPAPPVAPRSTTRLITTAAPTASAGQTSTKSRTCWARPAIISSSATRLTSFSTVTGAPSRSRSRPGRSKPSQPGRCGANPSLPVAGSTAPGLPTTTWCSASRSSPAWPAAVRTASTNARSTSAVFPPLGMAAWCSVSTAPVMSAMATSTAWGVRSTPATCASAPLTVHSWERGPRAPPRSPARSTVLLFSSLVSSWAVAGLDKPIRLSSSARVNGPCRSSISIAARSLISRSSRGLPARICVQTPVC